MKKKNLLLYVLFVFTVIFMIFASDESKKPLVLNAGELHREAGSVDGISVSVTQDSAYSGVLLETVNYMLPKGNYTVGVEYRTDNDSNTLTVLDNGKLLQSENLTKENTYSEYPLSLGTDSQEIILNVNYSGTGTLSVQTIRIIPEGRFYNDAAFFAVLFLLVNLLGIFIYHTKWFRSLSKNSRITLFLLAGIAVAASFPYFNGYLNWGDDLCYHLLRIEGIKDGLLDGQLPVVVYPEGLKGNGYLNCMYPNLFLYIPALLRILGVSMVSSYKTLVCLFHFATAFLTYYSVKSICNNRKAAIAASLLYTLCPYRFTNFYARGAVGEALAMTFFPLLIAGLYHVLSGNRKKWPLLVFGMSGLIQTHVLSALLGAVLCVLFGLLYIVRVLREKRLIEIALAAGLTVLCNLWFIVPFLYFYQFGNLETSALDWSDFSEYSLNFSGLIGTLNPSAYRSLTLGIPIFLCAFICLFFFIFEYKTVSSENESRENHFVLYLFLLGVLCALMATSLFPGQKFMDIGLAAKFLKNVQFPWRLLGLSGAFLIISGCITLSRSQILRSYAVPVYFLLIGITLLSAFRFKEDDFAYQSYDSAYTIGHAAKVNGIIMGENSVSYPYEWCPVGSDCSNPPLEAQYANPDGITVFSYSRSGTTTTLQYSNTAPEQTASFPIIAYAGYKAYDNGSEIPLLPNGSYITAALNSDGNPHELVIKYKGKAVFTIAFIISILTILVWIIYKMPFKGRRMLTHG